MNIYLIGYRGTGKSTVAPLVAELLALKSVDSDQEIEILVGDSISDIFAKYGEAGFRQWESTVIEGLAQHSDHVISLGGGAILDPLNRLRIARTGKTVWLKAEPETLWNRIKGDLKSDTLRPNLTDKGGFAEIVEVLKERTPLYQECADFTVDVTRLEPEEVAKLICMWIEPI